MCTIPDMTKRDPFYGMNPDTVSNNWMAELIDNCEQVTDGRGTPRGYPDGLRIKVMTMKIKQLAAIARHLLKARRDPT
jgi:hypothetical protein